MSFHVKFLLMGPGHSEIVPCDILCSAKFYRTLLNGMGGKIYINMMLLIWFHFIATCKKA
jgi:hypothetical protein